MTPRPRARKGRRSARRKPARDGRSRAAAPSTALRTGSAHDGRRAAAARPKRPRRTGAVVRFVVVGALLGPGLGITLGPWLAANRLPLYEARITWRGPAPGPGEWPHAPGPGESAATRAIGARAVLVARAPSPAGAEALALELALPRLSRAPELASTRDARRADWTAPLVGGPAATLTPAGDCAARLRGWAAAWRAVAAAPPAAQQEPGPARRETPLPVENDVARLALAADGPGLEDALQREARLARAHLFTKIGFLTPGPREVATEAWRRAWGRRAAELDTLAEALLARTPPIERELVARVAPAYALDAEPRIPDPGVIQLLAASGSEPSAARPVFATWILFAAAGSAFGLLIAWPLARRTARVRRARHEELSRRSQAASQAFTAIPPAATGSIEARIQVVSGPHPRRAARVALELAARCVAFGERVLVMDGDRHLRLHDSFGAQPHLGFQECMREEFPLLGVLQSGGLPGLYFLAHGAPSRLASWTPLMGLLDQAQPYFSRVILALEPNVARQAGEALAGRLMDGWWAAPDVRTRHARRFSTRIGTALQGVEPAAAETAAIEAMVEEFKRKSRPDAAPAATPAAAAPAPSHAPAALDALVEELARDAAPAAPAPVLATSAPALARAEMPTIETPEHEPMLAPEEVPALAPAVSALAAAEMPTIETPKHWPTFAPEEVPALEPGPGLMPAPSVAEAAPSAAPEGPPAGEPLVLESDPEVSERLRFLIWMRRLRDKSRGEVAHTG